MNNRSKIYRYEEELHMRSREDMLAIYYALAEQDEPEYQKKRVAKDEAISRIIHEVACRMARVDEERARLADPQFYVGHDAGYEWGYANPYTRDPHFWAAFRGESPNFLSGAVRGARIGRQHARAKRDS